LWGGFPQAARARPPSPIITQKPPQKGANIGRRFAAAKFKNLDAEVNIAKKIMTRKLTFHKNRDAEVNLTKKIMTRKLTWQKKS
jgi:hypothetical protein